MGESIESMVQTGGTPRLRHAWEAYWKLLEVTCKLAAEQVNQRGREEGGVLQMKEKPLLPWAGEPASPPPPEKNRTHLDSGRYLEVTFRAECVC